MKIYKNPNSQTWSSILIRPLMETKSLNKTVADILHEVKKNGDAALMKFNEKFDKVLLENIEVTEKEFTEAENQLDEKLKAAIQTAYQNIKKFHEAQQTALVEVETMPGVRCWQKSVPIGKVGLYIPGGTAPLFSTILMLGIPAKVAGCKEIVMCTPPQKDGSIHPAMLYTAKLIGIEDIFKVGGAQAIGAMTYGTEIIPQVYKIFGPGNQFVTTAKQLVSLEGVAIDMPAGPSEVLVVADETADAEFVAADLLSQAEHGADSQVVLISFSEEFVNEVLLEIEMQLENLPRKEIAEQALANSPAIILADKNAALKLINEYAPEHLIIATKDADDFAKEITNAGSVFIGNYAPESVGDYASGTNHTLPTNGFAKNYSGVNLDAFSKKISYQKLTKKGLQNIGQTVELMAAAEQLEAHKNAVTIRLNKIKAASKNAPTEEMAKRKLAELVRPNILDMAAYASARSEFKGSAEVFLDANENPFGNNLNRYPDPLQMALKEKIGAWRGVPIENIFLGNGSDEAIDLVIRIFCRPQKDRIITLPPTYGMYKVSAATSNILIKEISLDQKFQPRVKAILAAADVNDKILFLCSPNNPTGNVFDFEKIKELVEGFDGIVVVDEAYIDFTKQNSCISLLKEFKNLIILQTFSKAWGMAGIRLGMAFASKEIIDLFNKVKPPYNVNQLTQQIALEAFDRNKEFDEQVNLILEQRFFLEKALLEFDFVERVFPSDANFLLVKNKSPNQLYKFLINRKIIVRNRSKQVGCEGCLRITIGTKEENEKLINSLKEFAVNNLQNEKSIISR